MPAWSQDGRVEHPKQSHPVAHFVSQFPQALVLAYLHSLHAADLECIDWSRFDEAARSLAYLTHVSLDLGKEERAEEFVAYSEETGLMRHWVERDMLWLEWQATGADGFRKTCMRHSEAARRFCRYDSSSGHVS